MSNFVLSYFSGCGGFSLGAKAAGCDTLGVEYDRQIAELYRDNVGDVVVADVTTLNPSKLEFPGVSDRRRDGSLLIWQLSPECKKFSRANTAAKSNRAEAMASESATSIQKIWWHEQVIQPDAIVLENVEDYLKYEGYQNFCKYLVDEGYRVTQVILNAADFGVPQKRRRLIMVATRSYLPIPKIIPTHSRIVSEQVNLLGKWVNWYDAIKDLDLPGSELTQAQRSVATGCNEIIERVGYYKTPKVAPASEPCWTLRSHLADDGKGGSRSKVIDAVIDGNVRSLNTCALARLQSFPDLYKWSGRNSLDVRAIGNAVPPLMAQRIVEAILHTS